MVADSSPEKTEKDDWIPTFEDIHWVENVIRFLNPEGAFFGIPACGGVVKITKNDKTFRVIEQGVGFTVERILRILIIIGFTKEKDQ